MKGRVGTSCGLICTKESVRTFRRQVRNAKNRHEKASKKKTALSKPANLIGNYILDSLGIEKG